MLEMPDHRLKLSNDLMRRHKRHTRGLVELIRDGIRQGELKDIDPEFAAFSLAGIACIVVERSLCCEGAEVAEDIRMAVDLFMNGVSR
jgi:hypothetical protein